MERGRRFGQVYVFREGVAGELRKVPRREKREGSPERGTYGCTGFVLITETGLSNTGKVFSMGAWTRGKKGGCKAPWGTTLPP